MQLQQVMDNFFTPTDLLGSLHTKTDYYGTVRPNQKATPMNFGKTKGKLSTGRG